MAAALRRAYGFARRDAVEQFSYRAAFAADLFSTLFSATMFFFLAQLVDRRGGAGAIGDYFGFVLAGIALSDYLLVSINGLADQIRRGQLTGTLELLFLTPGRSWEVVAWGNLWSFIYRTTRVATYVIVGMLFGLRLNCDWMAVIVTLILSALALAPLGILAATITLVWKKTDPVVNMLVAGSTLFAGVYYPISVLPWSLQMVSRILPLTYAVEGFRASLLHAASLSDLAGTLAALAAFALVLTPPTLFAFSSAVRWAKRNGALGQY